MRNLIIALVLSVMSVGSFAIEKTIQPQITVEYVGTRNSQPLYKMTIKNPEKVKLNVVIRDMDGILLHEEVVEGPTIVKNYCFATEEVKASDIIIEVTRLSDPLTAIIRLDKKPVIQK